MNNPSPLVPQGSMFEQKNQRRARVKIAVYFVLAVHGVGLLALLMQGCRKNNSETGGDPSTNSVSTNTTFEPPANTVVAESNLSGIIASNPPVVPTVDTNTSPTLSAGQDYKIVAGDNFWTIGKKFGVSAKAIADANSGLDPNKLKVNQTIHIPPAVKSTSPAAVSGPTTAEPGAGQGTYKVKSGDTLIKIANDHHTTVKALRAANNLKTDSIKVDQVLKLPAKSTSSDATPAPGTTAPPHSR